MFPLFKRNSLRFLRLLIRNFNISPGFGASGAGGGGGVGGGIWTFEIRASWVQKPVQMRMSYPSVLQSLSLTSIHHCSDILLKPSKTILQPFWVSFSLTKAKSCPGKTPQNLPKPGKTHSRISLDQKKNPVQIPHSQDVEGLNWSASD